MTSDPQELVAWMVVLQVEGQTVPDFYDVEAPTATAALATILEKRRSDMQNPPTVQAVYVVPQNPLAGAEAVEDRAQEGTELGLWSRVRRMLGLEGREGVDVGPVDSEGRPTTGELGAGGDADLEVVE